MKLEPADRPGNSRNELSMDVSGKRDFRIHAAQPRALRPDDLRQQREAQDDAARRAVDVRQQARPECLTGERWTHRTKESIELDGRDDVHNDEHR